ncbi:hypothetical protein LTS18_011868, partial [Coniosporium uncinatum]
MPGSAVLEGGLSISMSVLMEWWGGYVGLVVRGGEGEADDDDEVDEDVVDGDVDDDVLAADDVPAADDGACSRMLDELETGMVVLDGLVDGRSGGDDAEDNAAED